MTLRTALICLLGLGLGCRAEADALQKERPTPVFVSQRAEFEALRQAEVANCVQRHNAECCLFPLRGGGVHTEKEPARRAKAALLAALAKAPQRLDAIWLLNITSMALGEYPDGVPAEFRIPESAFASEEEAGRFRDVAPALGLATVDSCGGVIVGDFDHDGDQDLMHQLGGFFPGDAYANALFENPGNANHHVVLRLVGTKSNRDAVGARIRVDAGGRSLFRFVGSVSSFGGSPLRQEIGLGAATRIDRVQIDWPAGRRQVLAGLAVDTMYRVTEGKKPVRIKRKRVRLGGG